MGEIKQNRPHHKPERNIALVRDQEAGMSYSELAAKYGISRERVRQLVKKGERRKLRDQAVSLPSD